MEDTDNNSMQKHCCMIHQGGTWESEFGPGASAVWWMGSVLFVLKEEPLLQREIEDISPLGP